MHEMYTDFVWFQISLIYWINRRVSLQIIDYLITNVHSIEFMFYIHKKDIK